MNDVRPFNINVDEVLQEYGLEDNHQIHTDFDVESLFSPSLEPPILEDVSETNTPSDDEPTEEDFETNETTSITTNQSGITESTSTSTEETISEESITTPSATPVPPIEDLLELLPVNSEVFKLKEHTSRFSGAEWFRTIQSKSIVLAGLGGIGSYVLFCLSRVSPKHIYLYDDDTVELANLSGQLYNSEMIGRKKVEAMAKLAEEFSMYLNISAIPQKFTSSTKAGDIMICGFDNMEARKGFFNAWLNHVNQHPTPQDCLFIDGRL